MQYTFDKSSKKFICPKCNKKRFVKFVDVTTNGYLSDNLGKCDRESSCGYFCKPNSPFPKSDLTFQSNLKPNLHEKKVISQHSICLLQKTLTNYNQNNLYNYLLSYFHEANVNTILINYKVGTSKAWHGSTVFWQVDDNEKVRAGKIILYDKSTGKRVKEPYPCITWVHSKLKLEDFNLNQCLFGLHLLKKKKKIALVESEKTAIIMALFLPEYIWMATGSKQNFKEAFLIPIIENPIIVFPDKSEFEDWNKKSIELNKVGFKIEVSNYLETLDFCEGSDLADILVSSKNKTIDIALSTQEVELIRLAKINPDVITLIETFDLLDCFNNPINTKKIRKHI
jgi:hypothetical protein